MTNESNWQVVFNNLEQIYNRKISDWDKESFKDICKDLNGHQIVKVFIDITRNRTNNFYITPNEVQKKKDKLYPPKNKENSFKYHECNACYNTGIINCKESRIKSDKFSDYTHQFICKCNNVLKLNQWEIKELIEFKREYLKHYTPINELIKNKYNNSYNNFIKDYQEYIIQKTFEGIKNIELEQINKTKLITLGSAIKNAISSQQIKECDKKNICISNDHVVNI